MQNKLREKNRIRDWIMDEWLVECIHTNKRDHQGRGEKRGKVTGREGRAVRIHERIEPVHERSESHLALECFCARKLDLIQIRSSICERNLHNLFGKQKREKQIELTYYNIVWTLAVKSTALTWWLFSFCFWLFGSNPGQCDQSSSFGPSTVEGLWLAELPLMPMANQKRPANDSAFGPANAKANSGRKDSDVFTRSQK